jgi:hypothetical protein
MYVVRSKMYGREEETIHPVGLFGEYRWYPEPDYRRVYP